MSELHRLRARLCRELARSEQSARGRPLREALRLGQGPRAAALRTLAEHAEIMRPRFEALLRDQPARRRVERWAGRLIAALRRRLFPRAAAPERDPRGALGGLRHGVDTARRLREVARQLDDAYMVAFCDELLARRLPLIARAEGALPYPVGALPRAVRPELGAARPIGP